MSLYTNWTDMVVEYVKTKGENAFWAEYSKLETFLNCFFRSNYHL